MIQHVRILHKFLLWTAQSLQRRHLKMPLRPLEQHLQKAQDCTRPVPLPSVATIAQILFSCPGNWRWMPAARVLILDMIVWICRFRCVARSCQLCFRCRLSDNATMSLSHSGFFNYYVFVVAPFCIPLLVALALGFIAAIVVAHIFNGFSEWACSSRQ